MFERFTDRARRVVVLARDEADGLRHHHIGPEHLLLGLIREGAGVAAKVFGSLEVTADDVHAQIVSLVGEGISPPSGHIPFLPSAKRVLERAETEALQLGHHYIGTEHQLLGLLRSTDDRVDAILTALNLDRDKIRRRTLELIGRASPEATASVPLLTTELGSTGYTVGAVVVLLSEALTAAYSLVEEAYAKLKDIPLPDAKVQVAEICARIGMPTIRIELCVKHAYQLHELITALLQTKRLQSRDAKLGAAVTLFDELCVRRLEAPPGEGQAAGA